MKLYNIEVLLSFLSDKGFKDENINSNDRDEYYFQKGWNNGVLWVMEAIATLMPDMQMEAEPVRHGEWKKIGTYRDEEGYLFDEYGCSLCNRIVDELEHYCPDCGAKMYDK